jgi:hypothetical protein
VTISRHLLFLLSHKTILLLLTLLGNLHFLNCQFASFHKLTAQRTNLLRGEVCVCLMDFACCHRLDGQNLQQMGLDRLVRKLGLAGLGTPLGVPLVQLLQLGGGVAGQLVIHVSIDNGIEELTISHNFLLSSADRSPPIFIFKRGVPLLITYLLYQRCGVCQEGISIS